MAAKEGNVSNPLNILEKLDTEEREKFIHRAINDLCEKEGLKYEDYPKLLSLTEYSKLKNSISDVIKTLSREEIKKEQVIEKLNGMSVSSEVSRVVARCLWVRREEIRSQLIRNSCSISHSHLTDFDWKLKLIMSSDQLGSIRQPVVSVDFDLTESGQRRKENIELSKDELAQFIASLEAANKVVSQLRT